MKIEVYENIGGSNDDLLNKIDDMGLSHLSVTFNWASAK